MTKLHVNTDYTASKSGYTQLAILSAICDMFHDSKFSLSQNFIEFKVICYGVTVFKVIAVKVGLFAEIKIIILS